jgi:hypothetical protein
MLIPLTMKEMIIAEKFYPIVFKKEEVIPYALLGIPQRKNFYLLPDGRWKVPYVPNYIRQYPFAWLKTRQEYKIGADLSAPHFSHLDGSPLFEGDEPSPLLKEVISYLKSLHIEIIHTKNIFSILDEFEVLVEKEISITLDKENFVIKGIRLVDLKKLSKLHETTLTEWVKIGLLSLIYAHVHSLENLKLYLN